jgi:hypothetical protein
LNTLHSDVIEILSSSSYALSLFSFKAGSAHGTGGGVAHGVIEFQYSDDLWPEIDSVEGFGDGGLPQP